MKRVLLSDSIAPAGEEALRREVEVIRAPDSDVATLRKWARDVDGVLTRSKLPDDLFDAAPRVRGVVVHGTGTDLVPLADATARGVPVSNIPGGNAQSVAEYCVLAMLLLSRKTLEINAALKNTSWDQARTLGAGTHEIAAMTAGIVGVGEIGTRLARICHHGFGMRVLGHQRRVDRLPAEALETRLDDLVAKSDFVVVTCPLTPETHHLFNEQRIGLMKKTAWLINVGRGAVVHEEALINSLKQKRIAGVMLDVYEHYRLEPGHPLLSLDNAILTPHLAGMTVESRARMSVAAAEEMLLMLSGKPPKNWVNRR